MPSISKSNEEEIFNPAHIANRFCEYFTNIGPNLVKSIPVSDKSHHSFLNRGFINSFYLQSASEQEVTEICSSFWSGTAPKIKIKINKAFYVLFREMLMVQWIGYGENAMFIVIIMKHALQIINCRLGIIIYHRFRTEVSLLANKENCKISKANLTGLFFWHLEKLKNGPLQGRRRKCILPPPAPQPPRWLTMVF